jgi:hypothetical protein
MGAKNYYTISLNQMIKSVAGKIGENNVVNASFNQQD